MLLVWLQLVYPSWPWRVWHRWPQVLQVAARLVAVDVATWWVGDAHSNTIRGHPKMVAYPALAYLFVLMQLFRTASTLVGTPRQAFSASFALLTLIQVTAFSCREHMCSDRLCQRTHIMCPHSDFETQERDSSWCRVRLVLWLHCVGWSYCMGRHARLEVSDLSPGCCSVLGPHSHDPVCCCTVQRVCGDNHVLSC